MRKIIFYCLIFINISIIKVQAIESYDIIDKKYIGIYLPTEYIRSVELTKNHSFSLGLNRERGYHDVLIVMENIIYSDYGFCDQYAIKTDEASKFEYFIDSNNEILIRDNNGGIYKKISENIENYYMVVSDYIGKIILDGLFKLGLTVNQNNVYLPFLDNQNYEIVLYEKGIYLLSNIVLRNVNNEQWLYLNINDKKYTFYNGQINGLQIIRTNEIIYEIEI
jgi:hypothetical protein